jgi:ribosome modulation factor
MTKARSYIFDMTQVTESDWYNGYRAFLHGAPDTDNPFAKMTPGYFQWHNGWHTARQDFIEQGAKSGNPHRPENPSSV